MTTTRKRGAASAAPEGYKADAYYRVQLSRSIQVAPGRFLAPRDGHRIKGSYLATLPPDCIVTAVEVAAAGQVEG